MYHNKKSISPVSAKELAPMSSGALGIVTSISDVFPKQRFGGIIPIFGDPPRSRDTKLLNPINDPSVNVLEVPPASTSTFTAVSTLPGTIGGGLEMVARPPVPARMVTDGYDKVTLAIGPVDTEVTD